MKLLSGSNEDCSTLCDPESGSQLKRTLHQAGTSTGRESLGRSRRVGESTADEEDVEALREANFELEREVYRQKRSGLDIGMPTLRIHSHWHASVLLCQSSTLPQLFSSA